MWAVESLKICTLMGYFCRICNVWVKKYGVAVSWKITCGFKNDIRNLEIWWTNSWK